MRTENEVKEKINWPKWSENTDGGHEVPGNNIPRELFVDENLFELEMEKIFYGPAWHLIAHEAEIPYPGDFKTTRIGKVPVIVVRDKDSKPNAVINACAHRGAKVLTERCGNALNTGMKCIYHQWTYDTQGRCIGVPFPEDFPEDFKKEDYGLPKVRLEILAGAIFATLSDKTPPLREYLADEDFIQQIQHSLYNGNLKLLGQQKMVFRNNWKIQMENMYDGYHALALHKAVRMLTGKSVSSKTVALEGAKMSITRAPSYDKYGHGWQHYYNAGNDEGQFNDMSIVEVRTKEKHENGLAPNDILFAFPANIISDQADTLTIRYVLPVSIDKTEVHYTIFANADEGEDVIQHRIRQGSNLFGPVGLITLEDGAALSRIQMSAHAKGENLVLKGSPRRFPPYRLVDEASIRHFYAAYRRYMDI